MLLNYPKGTHRFQSHLTDTQLHSRINFSPLLLSTGKGVLTLCQTHSWNAIQRAALSVLETPQNELFVSLMVTHMSSIISKCILIVHGDRWTESAYGYARGSRVHGDLWRGHFQTTPGKRQKHLCAFPIETSKATNAVILGKNLYDKWLSLREVDDNLFCYHKDP